MELILFVVAAVCFALAAWGYASADAPGNAAVWQAAGLAILALAHIAARIVLEFGERGV